MPIDKPILVTGAAGRVGAVGRTVVEVLRQRGLPVRALVRLEDERADALRAIGAEVVVGDLTSPNSPSGRCWCRRAAGALSRLRRPLLATRSGGVTAAVPMMTKGGLETITRHLAMEYAKDGVRVNAVAPGVVYLQCRQHDHRNCCNCAVHHQT